jgi:hypothetical protein
VQSIETWQSLCVCAPKRGAHSVAAAVLWRKHQSARRRLFTETKPASGNFSIMVLAITGQWATGQWVAEITTVLCLFGAACIGVAIFAGEGAAPRQMEQKAVERHQLAAQQEIPKAEDE